MFVLAHLSDPHLGPVPMPRFAELTGKRALGFVNWQRRRLVRAVGAVSERLHTPASARDDALRAVTRALRDRQTVVLSLPLDVQHAPVEYVQNTHKWRRP